MVWKRFIHVDLGVYFLRSEKRQKSQIKGPRRKSQGAVFWESYKVPPTHRLYNVRCKGNWESMLYENYDSLFITKIFVIPFK